MCGRSSLTKTEKELEERFNATFYSEDLKRYNPLPNYNIAPTHYCPIITADDRCHINIFRWGLIPFWAKEEKIGYRMINARVETLMKKSTYKSALKNRRCLVPLDGFYEWKREGTNKIPYRIHTTDQDVFAVAGLWDKWKSKGGEVIYSFTIITTPPNELMASIHNRMPAILTKDQEELWLDDNIAPYDAGELLYNSYPPSMMRAYRVSDRVGNVRNNDPDLIMPI